LEKSQEQETSARAVSPDAANPSNPTAHLHTKQRGELAELAFMLKAVSMGFGVAKPWGDSDRYDIILSAGQAFLRIQIKSTWSRKCHQVNACGNSRSTYTANEIDFLAAYIIPRDIWYVVSGHCVGVAQVSPLFSILSKIPTRTIPRSLETLRRALASHLTNSDGVTTDALVCPSRAARRFFARTAGTRRSETGGHEFTRADRAHYLEGAASAAQMPFAASKQQVPPLRKMIRFADHLAPVGMT
jgi:PD-(D/E)XK endonuclease